MHRIELLRESCKSWFGQVEGPARAAALAEVSAACAAVGDCASSATAEDKEVFCSVCAELHFQLSTSDARIEDMTGYHTMQAKARVAAKILGMGLAWQGDDQKHDPKPFQVVLDIEIASEAAFAYEASGACAATRLEVDKGYVLLKSLSSSRLMLHDQLQQVRTKMPWAVRLQAKIEKKTSWSRRRTST